jgi:hypothetical protein
VIIIPMDESVEMNAGLTRATGASNCRVLGAVPLIEVQPATTARIASRAVLIGPL